MNTEIRERLKEFYVQNGIHPQNFHCKNQKLCRPFAFQGKMTETKMSMVGSQYSLKYPKIVVVSLDPPSGQTGIFSQPHQRTTEYVSSAHEAENYTVDRKNPHWMMTQIIVKDLLSLWGYKAQTGSASVTESYSGRIIENVSSFFAHVNVAKCSMNHPDRAQADEEVHTACSRSYLKGELTILDPELLISQGAIANRFLGYMLTGHLVEEQDLPISKEARLRDHSVLWLPMHHPARQLAKIREEWPFYLGAVREWKNKSPSPIS
jgi:hypothetical protein